MDMTSEQKTLGQKLFINRDFALLFWGRLVSQIGDGIHYLALTWLVLDLTGSGTALGTMLFASSIPMVILAPFSGVLADLWDRKTIIVSMDILRGLIILALALVYRAGALTMPILYAATVFSSLAGVLFGPAISAALPGLVEKEELVKANSLNTFSRAATSIIGPVVGAFLLGFTGYFGVFLLNGTAFILSAISEMFIRFPRRDGQQSSELPSGSRFFASFREGFAYIWQNLGLRTMIFFAVALNFIFSPLGAVALPYFGKEVLLLDAQHFGTVKAMMPVGYLLGTAVIGLLTKKFKKESLLSTGIIVQGIVIGLMGFYALPQVYGELSLPVLMFCLSASLLVMGVFNIFVNVPFQVMLQETVPDAFRGRVFGLLDSMVQMLVPLSMALSGFLVDSFSLTTLFFAGGGMGVVLGLAMAASPNIKQLYLQQEAAG